MEKELPYFKFFPGKWLTGNITILDPETQGLFINLCCHYWLKKGSICLANTKQRFSKYEAQLEQLLSSKIVKVNEDEKLVIEFLDEQLSGFGNISEIRSEIGRKGGLAKAKQLLKRGKTNAKIKEDISKPEEKNWKNDFDIYLQDLKKVYTELLSDPEYIKMQSELHPGVDIHLSLKKAVVNFWGTEAGWRHKKKARIEDIDWKSTLTNAIDLNRVYKDKKNAEPQRKITAIPDNPS